MHHLHGATGESEGHGPQGSLARPVDEVVDFGHGVFDLVGGGHGAVGGEEFVDGLEALERGRGGGGGTGQVARRERRGESTRESR